MNPTNIVIGLVLMLAVAVMIISFAGANAKNKDFEFPTHRNFYNIAYPQVCSDYDGMVKDFNARKNELDEMTLGYDLVIQSLGWGNPLGVEQVLNKSSECTKTLNDPANIKAGT
ncbi:hypothetical protein HY993_03215 [Candidatus Micrarchaeota archaeon]|nr:hypothetical protein [Candidatus Micrarchaeota archaeon]